MYCYYDASVVEFAYFLYAKILIINLHRRFKLLRLSDRLQALAEIE